MKASRIAKATLFALFWANFLNFLDRQVIAALAPVIQESWQLSDTQVGLLATAFEITYALAPLPVAFVADRWLRRRVVALALAMWSGAMVVMGAAGSFVVLLVGRAGLGLGEASYGPSALAWLSDLFSPSQRSRAVGIHDLALMFGSAAGYALGGMLGVAMGWRPVFFVAALPGFILAAIIWFLPEPPKGQSDYQALGVEQEAKEPSAIAPRSAIRELLSVRTLVVTYAVAVLINLALSGIVYWLPSFAVRVHGLGVDQAGLIIGGLTIVAGGAGVLAGGIVADWLLVRMAAGRLLLMSVSVTLGVPLALGAIFVNNTVPFFILAMLAVFCFTFYFPCLAPLLHQVTRPELRATAMGLYLLIVHLLGNAVAPALIGWLSDEAGDLRLGLAAALVLALVGALIGFWGLRFVGRDTRAMLHELETS